MTASEAQLSGTPSTLRRLTTKVPEVTVGFWVIKVLTTGMGETASDFLAHTIGPVATVAITGLAIVAAMVLQFRAPRYVPWVYWTAVVMVSVFGTVAADVAHLGLGIPYAVSTAGFAVALAVVLVAWYRSERTLSIHSIHTRRRETYYWATVLVTFALGTAAGDLTAVTLRWGYLGSGLLFVAVIAVPALLHWRLGLNPIVAFWWAYIVTRPLGASFADWMAVSHQRGGLAMGTGPVTLVWSALIVVAVALLSQSRFAHRRPVSGPNPGPGTGPG